MGHNNTYICKDTYTCVWGRVIIHRLIFIYKNTWIFIFFFDWQHPEHMTSAVYYNGIALHINLEQSLPLRDADHGFLAMRGPGKFCKTILLGFQFWESNWALTGVLTVGVWRTLLHNMLVETEPVPPNIRGKERWLVRWLWSYLVQFCGSTMW